MTVQTATYTVTLTGADEPEPLQLAGAAVGFVTTRWVVVQNLTPYILLLEGVGDNDVNEAAISPGTSNKYPWTQKNGPLVANWVNPIIGAPPSTPQVIVEYSDDPTDADFPGTYPAALQSGVTIGTLTGDVDITGPVEISTVEGIVSTEGAVDVIFESLSTTVPATFPSSGSFTALNAYSALLVVVVSASGAKVGIEAILVSDDGAAFPIPFQYTQGGNAATFLVPFACSSGATFQVRILSTPGSGAGGAELLILGITAPLTAQVNAPTGLPLGTYPVGGSEQAAHTFTGGGSTVLLAAPSSGLAYRLHLLNNNSGANDILLVGTTSGFLYGTSVDGVSLPLYGQIVAEGLTMDSSGAGSGYLTYDTIPIPTLQ